MAEYAPDNEQGQHAYTVTTTRGIRTSARVVYASDLADAKRQYGSTRARFGNARVRVTRATAATGGDSVSDHAVPRQDDAGEAERRERQRLVGVIQDALDGAYVYPTRGMSLHPAAEAALDAALAALGPPPERAALARVLGLCDEWEGITDDDAPMTGRTRRSCGKAMRAAVEGRQA